MIHAHNGFAYTEIGLQGPIIHASRAKAHLPENRILAKLSVS